MPSYWMSHPDSRLKCFLLRVWVKAVSCANAVKYLQYTLSTNLIRGCTGVSAWCCLPVFFELFGPKFGTLNVCVLNFVSLESDIWNDNGHNYPIVLSLVPNIPTHLINIEVTPSTWAIALCSYRLTGKVPVTPDVAAKIAALPYPLPARAHKLWCREQGTDLFKPQFEWIRSKCAVLSQKCIYVWWNLDLELNCWCSELFGQRVHGTAIRCLRLWVRAPSLCIWPPSR